MHIHVNLSAAVVRASLHLLVAQTLVRCCPDILLPCLGGMVSFFLRTKRRWSKTTQIVIGPPTTGRTVP